jgi:exodeoxyribonuclease V alpha subunit
MATKETLTVTFQKAVYQKPADQDGLSWGIYITDKAKITGKLDQDICVPDMVFDVVGSWERHPRYGKGFKFHAYSRRQPNGQWGTIAFLMQADGIGPVTAQNIWDAYGEKSIEALLDNPEQVAGKSGVSLERLQAAAEKLAPMIGEAKGKLPLLTLFKTTKIAANTAKRLMDLKWPDAVERLKKNPFLLMQLGGIAFKQCDSLRQKLKLPKDMPERVLAACIQAFSEKSDQVWLEPKDVRKVMTDLLELGTVNVQAAIDDLIEAEEVTQNPEYTEGTFYALAHEARIEHELALQLRMRMKMPGDNWPIEAIMNDDELTDHQKAVITHSMREGGRLIVLPGSPGTGKTFALAKIIQYFKGSAYCCAPTGKAAQRLSEGLTEKGLAPATTIHRMLEPVMVGNGFAFRINGEEGGFVDADVIAIDESSMVNNWLALSALRGIHPSTYIILVGDKNQLPPVGTGTMLRDLQELEFHELTEIQRNAGAIVKTCHAIKNGETFPLPVKPNAGRGVTTDDNVHVAFAGKDVKKAKKVEALAEAAAKGELNYVEDFMKDIQFLTATHRNTSVGREALNRMLQDIFNPKGTGKHKVYRVEDKIICLENTNIDGTDNGNGGKEFVANGELGVVVESNEKMIKVKMNSNPDRILTVPCGPDTGNGWDLGYCITCHKSQGSEWPVTVTVIGSDYGTKMVTCREWIYTAISRSSDCSIIVGSNDQIYNMVKVNRIWDRKSFLLEHMEHIDGEAARVPVEAGSGQEGAAALDF